MTIRTKYKEDNLLLFDRECNVVLAYGSSYDICDYYRKCSPLIRKWCDAIPLVGLSHEEMEAVFCFFMQQADEPTRSKILSLKQIDASERVIANLLRASKST